MGAWDFGSERKLDETSERSVDAATTERLIERAQGVLPITRISDITPLDSSEVPVFTAVTPLARDLTLHAGKGATPRLARISAMMEAVERVCAESTPRTVRARYVDLVGEGAVDPRQCDLPDDSTYDPEAELDYVQGFDLIEQRVAWLPADLVITPPREGVLHDVDTNGLASGNTLLEAVVHGLCEVIERDALSQYEFSSAFADRPVRAPQALRLSTLPSFAEPWLALVRQHGWLLRVHRLHSDTGVPVLQATLFDPAFTADGVEGLGTFPGFGAHPNKELALRRCVLEAFQSRTAFVQGARDSFNSFVTSARRTTVQAHEELLRGDAQLDFSEIDSRVSMDLRDDLEFLLGRLQRAGLSRALAFELTRPELNIPVVRVRVPGLSCFSVNRRRIGWRCWRLLV